MAEDKSVFGRPQNMLVPISPVKPRPSTFIGAAIIAIVWPSRRIYPGTHFVRYDILGVLVPVVKFLYSTVRTALNGHSFPTGR